MAFERLTRTGSKDELTYEERDPIFEKMRKKAISSIAPIDLISIETQPELLDRNLNYNFDDPDLPLSSLVKNVIWSLWGNDEARKNLFPKYLLEKDNEEDSQLADKRLEKFIETKKKHQTPEGRALINFVILAIRSGFTAMPLKKRVEEHIALQLEYFLSTFFEKWTKILKDKNRKFDPDKYENDEEREEAEIKFRNEGKFIFSLLTFVHNSEDLHSQIFSNFAEEGSMNVFGYFLRQLLGLEGKEVRKIMIGVIDKHFDLRRKEFLNLLDELRAENKAKTTKEKEAKAVIDGVSDGIAAKATSSLPGSVTKRSVAHVTSHPGKVTTISGEKVPVSERIERPQPETDSTRGEYNYKSGEETTVFRHSFRHRRKRITGRIEWVKTTKFGRRTGYVGRPNEETIIETDLRAKGADISANDEEILHATETSVKPGTSEFEPENNQVDKLLDDDFADGVAPEPSKGATADEKVVDDEVTNVDLRPEKAAKKSSLRANTPKVVKKYTGEVFSTEEIKLGEQEDVKSGQTNVIPPIKGIAFETPVPDKPKPAVPTLPLSDGTKEKITKLAEQTNDEFSQHATEPVPEAAVKAAARIEDITIPDLPSIENLGVQEKSILGEEDPEKRRAKLESWVARHPKSIKAVVLGVVLTVLGGTGYLFYKQKRRDTLKGKDKVALKSTDNTQKEKVIMAPAPAPRSVMEPQMHAPMRHAMRRTPMHPTMHVAGMKAPKEVMAASTDVMKPKPIQTPAHRTAPVQKTVGVRGVQSNPPIAFIDTKTIDDLPNGTYKEMWEGKAFDIQDAPFASVSGFMEQKLKDTINKLPSKKDRYKAIRAYYRELKQLERGWLIYMSEMEKDLQEKAMKGTLTAQEDAKLKYWESYKKSHRSRRLQAKWLTRRYEKLMKSKKKGYAYYKGLYQRGAELMEGLAELNPNLDDPNQVSQGQKVVFANGKKVLKTFWRFAHAMKLPMPEKGMGSTGELAPLKKVERKSMFAQHMEVTDDMVVAEYEVPPIPEDAVVHELDESDLQEVPMYGAGEIPVLKPILADMNVRRKAPKIPEHVRNQKPLRGKISHNDVYAEYSLERLDGGDYAQYSIKEDKPKDPLKPILADMVKKSQNDYAEYTVENENGDYDTYSVSELENSTSAVSEVDIPLGDSATIVPSYKEMTVENRPQKTPPPTPAMAEFTQQPQKKGLWRRAKSWLKSKVA